MKIAISGYPRIGAFRELKFATEKFFAHKLTLPELQKEAADLRRQHWQNQREYGIDFIPINDFSFYDNMLDMAFLFNVVPRRYRDLRLNAVDEYFAIARGYQSEKGDVKALPMKKWFNTNYHYLVPEIEDDTRIELAGDKLFAELAEAKDSGIAGQPVIIGGFTFLKLAKCVGNKDKTDFAADLARAYADILRKLDQADVAWLQIDEPSLVTDLSSEDWEMFSGIYQEVLRHKGQVKVLLQTYFGDIRDCYQKILNLPFDAVGLDFVEGRQSLSLVEKYGFPEDKILFAGVVNGKNIWRNNYVQTLQLVEQLQAQCSHIVLNTSCSLLYVPYTLKHESGFTAEQKQYLAFAEEKLEELAELKHILEQPEPKRTELYLRNAALFEQTRTLPDPAVQAKVENLSEKDFVRLPDFFTRERLQKQKFNLPLLPTTTIGSFPQTADVKANRAAYKREEISREAYVDFNKKKIAECIRLQEQIDLDVLVHGEFERNDMVEYFGENLQGFLFTQKAWVQSYGTRCVKPPIIWNDVSRAQPITVPYSVYAQSLTAKYVKGMLTGPVTILNWSFPREDIPLRESTLQIALAIREEVLDLEANGIKIIQIDEAALREKLPLRRSDWHSEYLDWAIPAFRLVHSGVQADTQIHTHMCYSEFSDIIADIDNMDADVITFESARSDLGIVKTLQSVDFQTETGPGVYDIHSPRIPSVEEIETALVSMLKSIPGDKLWVNPDCGLKTRDNPETVSSLKNLVSAAAAVRRSLTS